MSALAVLRHAAPKLPAVHDNTLREKSTGANVRSFERSITGCSFVEA
jgi:hypothetical protein